MVIRISYEQLELLAAAYKRGGFKTISHKDAEAVKRLTKTELIFKDKSDVYHLTTKGKMLYTKFMRK